MTIERPDPDSLADRAPALQDEFWGEQAEWVATDRRPSRQRAGFGATVGRWWGGLLGAGARAERVHGESHAADPDVEAYDDVAYDDVAYDGATYDGVASEPARPERFDDGIDDVDDADAWTYEPQPQATRRPGVDPLLARFGGLAVIATLAVPMVMGFVSDPDSETLPNSSSPAAAISIAPLAEITTPPPPSAGEPAPVADTTAAPDATTPVTVATAANEQSPVDAPAAAALEVEPSETVPVDTAAPCGDSYELAAGDYWIRIADAADVPLAELLEVNDASVDTVLVPGRSICLPVGASTPAPPATAAPTTTAASSTSTAGSASASSPRTTATTATPTTTVAPAPTTTAPARPPAVSAAEAVAIIREVWPDELEERAIEIAWRESNHRSNVNNSCCYGLFQIHWTAHQGWLSSVGVTSAFDLYDPRLNTVAAYTLYQRAGGFGPWGG